MGVLLFILLPFVSVHLGVSTGRSVDAGQMCSTFRLQFSNCSNHPTNRSIDNWIYKHNLVVRKENLASALHKDHRGTGHKIDSKRNNALKPELYVRQTKFKRLFKKEKRQPTKFPTSGTRLSPVRTVFVNHPSNQHPDQSQKTRPPIPTKPLMHPSHSSVQVNEQAGKEPDQNQ